MDSLEEIDRFLGKFNRKKQILDKPSTNTEIETVIKNLPKKTNARGQMASQNSIKHLEKS